MLYPRVLDKLRCKRNEHNHPRHKSNDESCLIKEGDSLKLYVGICRSHFSLSTREGRVGFFDNGFLLSSSSRKVVEHF